MSRYFGVPCQRYDEMGTDTGNASAFHHGKWHGKEAELFVREVGMTPMAASAPSVQWAVEGSPLHPRGMGQGLLWRVLLLAVRRGHGRLAKPTAAVRPGAAPRTQEAGRSAGRQGGQRRLPTPDLLQDRGVAPALSQRGLRAWRRSRRSGRRTDTAWNPSTRQRSEAGKEDPEVSGGSPVERSAAFGSCSRCRSIVSGGSRMRRQ